MERYLKSTNLPIVVLGAGGLGFLLRIWLLATGFDEKGLLVPGHPAAWLLWILTVAVLGIIIWGCWRMMEGAKYSFNFPASQAGAAGAAAAAVGILVTSIQDAIHGLDTFSTITVILGLLSACCLLFIANCRLKGRHPQIYFHGIVSLYLILRLVTQYRIWSPDPELLDYCFQLLATISLMLASYHRALFDANMGNRRLYAIFNMCGMYFCLLSVPGSSNWLFYLTCGAWMVTNPCKLMSLPSKKINADS